ncbi:hypothetical protein BpHYR1_006359 [Brachionus plicatilis]|uniref:Uncharacterized protein n=1 Tax=Brachionus plicatilis TaxID=10195 RepID=A0A3M7S9M1_BRAPC|nr:hypothetical protein BpHYR1_006359 [Brachionus plicatilis]
MVKVEHIVGMDASRKRAKKIAQLDWQQILYAKGRLDFNRMSRYEVKFFAKLLIRLKLVAHYSSKKMEQFFLLHSTRQRHIFHVARLTLPQIQLTRTKLTI